MFFLYYGLRIGVGLARLKLQVTLRYLATGDCFRSLESLYRVPKTTISMFLPAVLDAIYDALKEYIKVPNTPEEWASIARGFEEKWNFPGCCGALDGKHVNIQQPSHSNSEFYNYKGFYSTVLLALVDSNYCFTYIDVGTNGRTNDSTIFASSSWMASIEDKTLAFPDWGVIVGDDAFSLKSYLMKPYSRRTTLTREEKIYNYRVSRARRTAENAFGIMAMRFRIYRSSINLCLEKVDKIVRTTCALHNWLIKTSPRLYIPNGSLDTEDESGRIRTGSWRAESPSQSLASLQSHQGSNNYTQPAENRRKKYTEYFLSDGAVPWQWKMIE